METVNTEIKKIPYGRQSINDDDIAAVVEVLKSDWLTTGPAVNQFEESLCQLTGAKHAVAVTNGTAALHAGIAALELPPGSEIIVPAITFVASANAAVYNDCKPVFVDIEPDTLLLDAEKVEAAITDRTRAVVAVDYAGQPCDYDRLQEICRRHNLFLIADACHSIGATFGDKQVGQLADITTFSFHPVKHITTGEGGVVLTDSESLYTKARTFRNHGITADSRQREKANSHRYDMIGLGHNFRLSDINCALGVSQLKRLKDFVKRRREIARIYNQAFQGMPEIDFLSSREGRTNSYHLYPIMLKLESLKGTRDDIFNDLRTQGLGVNVHYLPVYEHSFYKNYLESRPHCPVADATYPRLLSLPMFSDMEDEDIDRVVSLVEKAVQQRRI